MPQDPMDTEPSVDEPGMEETGSSAHAPKPAPADRDTTLDQQEPDTLPLLCPGCAPATFVMMASEPATCARTASNATRAEAKTLGFPLEEFLERVGGDFEATVRWQDAQTDTTVDVTVVADADHLTLEKGTAAADEESCADRLLVALSIAVHTADDSLDFEMTADASVPQTLPAEYTWLRLWSPDAELHGKLQPDFGGRGEPQALIPFFEMTTFVDDVKPVRMSLEVMGQYGVNPEIGDPGELSPLLMAAPVDGCGVDQLPADAQAAPGSETCVPLAG